MSVVIGAQFDEKPACIFECPKVLRLQPSVALEPKGGAVRHAGGGNPASGRIRRKYRLRLSADSRRRAAESPCRAGSCGESRGLPGLSERGSFCPQPDASASAVAALEELRILASSQSELVTGWGLSVAGAEPESSLCDLCGDVISIHPSTGFGEDDLHGFVHRPRPDHWIRPRTHRSQIAPIGCL